MQPVPISALYLHQVMDGKMLAAKGKARRLSSQQTAHDVLLERHAVRVGRLFVADLHRVKHAVPAVAALAGLGEDVKN